MEDFIIINNILDIWLFKFSQNMVTRLLAISKFHNQVGQFPKC